MIFNPEWVPPDESWAEEREPRFLTHQAREGVPVDIGKVNVEQHEVGRVVGERLAGHLRALANGHAGIELPEPCGKQLRLMRIVFDHHDIRGWRADLRQRASVSRQTVGQCE